MVYFACVFAQVSPTSIMDFLDGFSSDEEEVSAIVPAQLQEQAHVANKLSSTKRKCTVSSFRGKLGKGRHGTEAERRALSLLMVT